MGLTTAQERRLVGARQASLALEPGDDDRDGSLRLDAAGPEPDAKIEGEVTVVLVDSPPEYCVFRVAEASQLWTVKEVTVVARNCPAVAPGMKVTVAGRRVRHPKWGDQIEAAWVATEVCSLAVVAAGFLRTRVNGIGPVRAGALLAEHGDRLPEVLADRQALLRVSGIGRVLVDEIVEAWRALSPQDHADLELAGMGVTAGAREALLEKFGAGAADAIKENPWIAVRARGLGMADADRLADKLGIGKDRPERAQALVSHVVDQVSQQEGSTRVQASVVQAAAAVRGIQDERYHEAVAALVGEGELVVLGDDLASAFLDFCEREIAVHLRRLRDAWWRSGRRDAGGVPEIAGIVPTEAQRVAVLDAQSAGVMVLSGKPGTGKTTITRWICDAMAGRWTIADREPDDVCGCSPTGRAADRLARATGRPAMTVHRLLGYGPRGWTYHAGNPLPAGLYVVDEVSMLDTALMWRLAQAIPDGSAVLFVGDHNQLPSVGAGAVLRDLIATQAVPVRVLDQIVRQAQGHPVIAQCSAVLEGRAPVTAQNAQGRCIVSTKWQDGREVQTADDVADGICRSVEWLRAKGHGPRDVQVLCAGKKSAAGTRELNRRLRQLWLPGAPADWKLVPGELVMQTKNDRDRQIWNGTQGVVQDVEEDGGRIIGAAIDWDGAGILDMPVAALGHVVPAWAMTIHKAQGCQWPWVLVALHMSMGYHLLVREVLYTALSRAQSGVVVVSPRRDLALAARNTGGTQRRTGLQERLLAAMPSGAVGGPAQASGPRVGRRLRPVV